MFHPRSFLLSALGLLCVGVPSAQAATWVWPDLVFPGPCSTSLQDCVNAAANGDTVLIGNDSIVTPDRYTGISGDLSISKSLLLAPMPGIDAVFEGGSVLVFTPLGAVGDVTLRGLVLRGGRVRVEERGSSSAILTLDQLRQYDPPAGQCGLDFRTTAATTVTPRFVVSNSSIVMTAAGGSGRSAICVYSNAQTYQAEVHGNRIDARNSAAVAAISMTAGSAAGAMNLRLQRNRIWLGGDSADSGIFAQHNNPAAAVTIEVVSNVISGAGGATGTENAAVVIKEPNAQLNIINNSITNGGVGIHVDALGAGAISGRVANNLLTRQSVRGLRFIGVALANDHNLLHEVAGNELGSGGVLGAGTLSVDPQVESAIDPRPRSTSPLFDAGDSSALPAFALFDADGEKRVQLGGIDIGAIEGSPDAAIVHEATAANTSFNATELGPGQFDGLLLTVDRLLVTPLRPAEGVSAGTATLGVYQAESLPARWAIFQQDQSSLQSGRRYSVLLPVSAHASLVHTVAAGNIPGAATAETQIDDPSLNNQAAAIAVVTPNWNPDAAGGGIYHDHPITLIYRGTRWRIRNDDGFAMTGAIGADFNLAVAPLFSPNAFMAELDAFGANAIPLSHPLLDDNPCAAPLASPRVKLGDGALTLNPTPFALEYRAALHANDIGRWYIVAEDAIGFSAHNAFNVIVEGAQANRCLARSDALFADGFD